MLKPRALRARFAFVGIAATLALCIPSPAAAFCGFFVSGADAKLYNNASQVVFMRKGNHTVMTMSNNYKGPPEDFAMVVPVPVVLQKGQVKTLRPEVFKGIDQLSAPRLVEYWERDPCYVEPPRMPMATYGMAPGSSRRMEKSGSRSAEDFGVTIEAKFQEGEYQILILSAKDSSGLDGWLRQEKYQIPPGAGDALAPYIREQMKFFVAKVDIQKVKRDEHGAVVLSPLRFSYDAGELRLPVRLGLLNAESKQDLLVFILSPESRYEVANYENAFIPTNVEVADSVRNDFGAFYGELFDETVRQKNGRAVVTEYAWQTPILKRPDPFQTGWSSYHCDPCPAPAIPPPTLSDWVTLGDEPILGQFAALKPGPLSPQIQLPKGTPEQWVLTRLHTRYDKTSLDSDLIFRAAKPIVGGRSNGDGTSADQGMTASSDGQNAFQGRYIIRHYWEGRVECSHPRYGIWTGPPGSTTGYAPSAAGGGDGTPKMATDLANAPRGKVKLASVVHSAIPALGLKGEHRAKRKGEH